MTCYATWRPQISNPLTLACAMLRCLTMWCLALGQGVLVDLYEVVRKSLLIGEPRYSIKNVERLYRTGRDTEVAKGDQSVAAYDAWLEEPSPKHLNPETSTTPTSAPDTLNPESKYLSAAPETRPRKANAWASSHCPLTLEFRPGPRPRCWPRR